MSLTDRQKQTIQQALQSKGFGACPGCRQASWQLADDLVGIPTTSMGGGMAIGGGHIPMAQIVCTRCGFVSHHAVGVLGFKLE